jgi:hypothetical protein
MPIGIAHRVFGKFKIEDKKEKARCVDISCSLAGEMAPGLARSLDTGGAGQTTHQYEWSVGLASPTEPRKADEEQQFWFNWLENSATEAILVQIVLEHPAERLFITDSDLHVSLCGTGKTKERSAVGRVAVGLLPGLAGIVATLSGVSAISPGSAKVGEASLKAVGSAANAVTDAMEDREKRAPGLFHIQRYLHNPGGYPGMEWLITRNALEKHGVLHRGGFSLRFAGTESPGEVRVKMRIGLRTRRDEQKGEEFLLLRRWTDFIDLVVVPRQAIEGRRSGT